VCKYFIVHLNQNSRDALGCCSASCWRMARRSEAAVKVQIDAPLLHIAHSAASSKPQRLAKRNFARWQRRLHGCWAVTRYESRWRGFVSIMFKICFSISPLRKRMRKTDEQAPALWRMRKHKEISASLVRLRCYVRSECTSADS